MTMVICTLVCYKQRVNPSEKSLCEQLGGSLMPVLGEGIPGESGRELTPFVALEKLLQLQQEQADELQEAALETKAVAVSLR